MIFNTYSCYDLALRRNYGDYMIPPKEGNREARHSFDAEIEGSFDYSFLSKED